MEKARERRPSLFLSLCLSISSHLHRLVLSHLSSLFHTLPHLLSSTDCCRWTPTLRAASTAGFRHSAQVVEPVLGHTHTLNMNLRTSWCQCLWLEDHLTGADIMFITSLTPTSSERRETMKKIVVSDDPWWPQQELLLLLFGSGLVKHILYRL